MSDHVSPDVRSRIMRSVHSENTGPEMLVRSAAHALGLRFRLHDKKLPGKPDMVLARWRTVIFVNGCYWHRHKGCRKASSPKSNIEFWNKKFDTNVERDKRNYRKLERAGWRVIVIWQCEVKTKADAKKVVAHHFFEER